ncbi:hypothetical protein [Mycobacterium sp.]|uniref:hypothetical protein n=1 Tax=Mycobacterium sp. TaxID=1785 RepID=UPI003CC57903
MFAGGDPWKVNATLQSGGSAPNTGRLDRPGRRHDRSGQKPPCPNRRRRRHLRT